MRLRFFLWILIGLTACAGAAPTYATTFVLMDEDDLTTRSTAVVTGWVTGVESYEDAATGGVNTYVSLEPTSIVAGALPDGEIVLRERGGRVPGHEERIYGAPEYVIGEQVLTFLSQNADGSLHTTAMAMGKYSVEQTHGGPAVATRQLGSEVMVFDRGTGRLRTGGAPEVADLSELVQHIRRAARHSRRPGSRVQLTPPELGTTVPHTYAQPFTYLGNPSRWFEPDFGQPVVYRIDPTGDARNGLAASRNAIDSAFAAWTDAPNSSLTLADGGLLDAPLAFTGCSGGSRIVFNDPFNEISDPTGCGGILAIGGYCTNSETKAVNGTAFQRIVLGKVVFNNGWEQCGLWDACNLAEVATHEIGHTLGLGHSQDNTATMAAVAHFDGRCARLGSDDLTAMQYVYPEGGVPTAPTATPVPQPSSTATPVPVLPTPTRTPTVPAAFSNDACVNATTITAAPYSSTAVTSSATVDARDPAPACGNRSLGKSVWYRFTPSSNGTLTANTFGSSYDTILAVFTGTCGGFSPVPGACNDDSAGTQSRVSFQAVADTTYYFLATAYSNNGGTLVFQLTFQAGTNTATPTPTSSPQPPTPTNTTGPAPTATATPVVPPATATSPPQPNPTNTSAPPPPPPNTSGVPNDFARAPIDVGYVPFSHRIVTTTATLDALDPAPSCGNRSRNRSVWYRFTPPSNGTLTVNTYGSTYDTILATFMRFGESFAAVSGACNDDSSGTQSRVSFQASAGTPYYFMVVSYGTTAGTMAFQLSFQGSGIPVVPTPTFTGAAATPTFTRAAATPTYTVRPATTPTSTPQRVAPTPTSTPVVQSNTGLPNDMCTGAIPITTNTYYTRIVTAAALAESYDPAPICGNRTRARSVWFRYTALNTGTLSVNTYGSTYDTILATYTGACGAMTPVTGGCNDDSVGAQSRVLLQAVAGTTYYFQVTAYRGDGGTLSFQLSN